MIEILTALLVLLTGFYAYVTYRILRANENAVAFMRDQTEVARRASTGQNILNLLSFLQDEKIQKARRLVHESQTLGERPWDDLTEDEKDAISKVCSTYDILGITIRHGVVPIEPFSENWGWSIQACCTKLDKYIKTMQSMPGRNAYWDDFVWLAAQIPKNIEDERSAQSVSAVDSEG